MCDYIKNMYGIQILKFKAEFQADVNGKLYLSFAKEISVRPQALQIDSKKREGYLKRLYSKDKEAGPGDTFANIDLPFRKIVAWPENCSKDLSPFSQKLYEVMKSHYTKVKHEIGINLNKKEGDNPIKVAPSQQFKKFVKNRLKKYFQNHSKSLWKPKKKKEKLNFLKTFESFKQREHSLDAAYPYIQITPQVWSGATIEKTAGSSLRSASKNMSQFKKHVGGRSISTKSRFFERPESHLGGIRGNHDICKASTKATTFHKERDWSVDVQRKTCKLSRKPYELPEKVNFLAQTFYNNEPQKLLDKTFDWAKMGNQKRVQNRIRKGLKYLVYVHKEGENILPPEGRRRKWSTKISHPLANLTPIPLKEINLKKLFEKASKQKSLSFLNSKSLER